MILDTIVSWYNKDKNKFVQIVFIVVMTIIFTILVIRHDKSSITIEKENELQENIKDKLQAIDDATESIRESLKEYEETNRITQSLLETNTIDDRLQHLREIGVINE